MTKCIHGALKHKTICCCNYVNPWELKHVCNQRRKMLMNHEFVLMPCRLHDCLLSGFVESKIIQGCSGIATQIYNSTRNVWKTAPAQPLLRKTARLTKCTQYNDHVHIMMNSEVLLYNFNKQLWNNLKTSKQHPEYWECRTLGAWRGWIVDIVENHNGAYFVSITICELVDQSRQE
jgi:hypothetical protein